MLIASVAAFVSPVEDPDFWWHIRVGRWMLEHGRLPSQDLFTYTVSGHAWTDHEYLTEILMWLGYSHLGLLAISLGFGLITWLGLLLIYQACRPGRRPYVIVGLGLALAAVTGGPIWGPRAQMVTFALACLELLWLRRYLDGSSRTINWLPLVMVLWANLHGGWVVAFLFLGVAGASELLQWVGDRSRAHLMRVRRLAIITALCAVAVAATPHGLALYLYPFQTQASTAQQHLIVEWFSPDFHLSSLRAFEVMAFLLIGSFALRRPSLYDFLLSMAALGLALQSVRHVAIFVAAATPVLVAQASWIWQELGSRHRLPLGGGARSARAPAVTALALGVIAAAVAVTVAGGALKQDRLTRDSFPVGAADYLAAHPEVGTRMYNQYGWGGYLLYRFYPDPSRRVFIFGEAALMGDRQLNRYQDVQTLRPDWRQVLDQERVDYVVYNRGEALANVLAAQPDWHLAYQDRISVIYTRSSPPGG